MTESRSWLMALAGLCLLSASIRYVNVNRMSLWGDEACMVFLCDDEPGEIIDALAATDRPDVDVAPPLYFLGLHGWMRVFGRRVMAVRGFSILFGTLTVLAAALLGKNMFSNRIGFLLGAFTAVHPFQVWYSQECRMYTMATCLAVFTLLALYSVMKQPHRPERWIIFGVLELALLYTQYYGFLLACASVGYLLWQARDPVSRRAVIRGTAGVAAGWVAGYAPWWIVLYRDFTQAGFPGGFPGFFHPLKTPVFLFIKMTLFGNEQYIRDHSILYAFMTIVAAVPLVSALRYVKDRRISLLVTVVIIPFLLVYIGSIAGMRVYKSHPFIIFQVPLLLLTAVGIDRLNPRISKIWTVFMLLSYGIVLNTLVLHGSYVKPRVCDVVNWIQPRYRAGDLVAVVPAFLPNPISTVGDLLVFKYYADNRYETVYLTGKNADTLSKTILNRFEKHKKLFLVYQDNPQIRPELKRIRSTLINRETLLESRRFPSLIRDFTMGVDVYKHARKKGTPRPDI